MGDENKHITTEAINHPQAEVGDIVEIEMAAPNVLKAAFIMYMVPLIGLFIGVGVATVLANLLGFGAYKDAAGAVVGIAAMVTTFLVIKKNESKFSESKEYLSNITKIVQSCSETSDS